ncbi:LacI family DNA-binding transcriptional regulator [Microbacterium marinilacus]|uniref:LacI family DNA-binding transcriptional regulator n=1 Tax=Microbacterium marinilacus TaxID=415209 RepID=A0ABP7BMS8_9MICO|nr:LacI family DNA-binding transcriptional regulator [Microbacterium marinilacus]MBY0690361.1 LacI family transcriptional regulator [Microbacterium marinilacus]
MTASHRRATLRDVAAEAGVSVSQASFALNGTGRVAPMTAARVRAAADTLGYAADARARALRTGQSDVYGVVIRNMRNPLFLDILRGMEERADAAGATLLIVSTNYSPEREQQALRRLTAQHVSGIAIAPIGGLDQLADGVRRSGWSDPTATRPLIAFHCSPPETVEDDADGFATAGPDEKQAVALALDELRRHGHRAPVLVAAPTDLVADRTREQTFLRLCAQWGLSGEILRCPLDARSIEQLTHRLCEEREHPALIVNSDYLAAGVYAAAAARDARVGTDLSVIGHDDLATSALLAPGLTTIRFDRSGLGRDLMDRLLVPGDAIRHTRMPVTLVPRASVAFR